MYVCVYLYVYICMYMCACEYVYINICMYVYMYVYCTCVYIFVCMYVRMYVCVYVYVYIDIHPNPTAIFFFPPNLLYALMFFLLFIFLFSCSKGEFLRKRAWMGTGSWVGWDTLNVSTRIEIFIFKHVVLHIYTVATVFHLFRISEIT